MRADWHRCLVQDVTALYWLVNKTISICINSKGLVKKSRAWKKESFYAWSVQQPHRKITRGPVMIVHFRKYLLYPVTNPPISLIKGIRILGEKIVIIMVNYEGESFLERVLDVLCWIRLQCPERDKESGQSPPAFRNKEEVGCEMALGQVERTERAVSLPEWPWIMNWDLDSEVVSLCLSHTSLFSVLVSSPCTLSP